MDKRSSAREGRLVLRSMYTGADENITWDKPMKFRQIDDLDREPFVYVSTFERTSMNMRHGSEGHAWAAEILSAESDWGPRR